METYALVFQVLVASKTIGSHMLEVMFDGASPNLATLLPPTVKEMNLWGLAGTKGISFFVALQRGNG
jgi:hypothetical protein